MANNISVKDSGGTATTIKTTDNSGVHTPHHNVDSLPGTVASDITAIKTAAEILDNAIAGNEMQVDVVTLPGSVQSHIGTLAGAVSGSEMQVDVVTIPNVTIGAALPAGTAALGTVGITEKTLAFATGTIATSGDNTVIAAQGGGIKIVITGLWLQNESTSATTLIVKNGATAIARFLAMNRGDALIVPIPTGREWKLSANTALVVNLSAANSCGYTIAYYTE